MNKDESRRIHEDWWGKCRSCRFWKGTDEPRHLRWGGGPCDNPESPLFGQVTSTEGYCPKWDSFDVDLALEMMQESEDDPRNSR